MCGIVGYVGEREAAPILLDGLARLEYRGYDSVGIAVLEENGRISIHKRVGKLDRLTSRLSGATPSGHQGIGHTRWATHGKPSDINAHPHTDCSGDVVVIHNGIVENHQELKEQLLAAGHKFTSETDTEVIAHLVEDRLAEENDLHQALEQTVQILAGAHAILVMSKNEPGTIVAARAGNAGGVVVGEWSFSRTAMSYGSRQVARYTGIPAARSRRRPSRSLTIPCRRRRAASSTLCRRKSRSSLRRF